MDVPAVRKREGSVANFRAETMRGELTVSVG
jgi:hypothetical protein